MSEIGSRLLPYRFFVLATLLCSTWLWFVTEPDKVVGKLDVKVGPSWSTIYHADLMGRRIMLGYKTYELSLTDNWGQHVQVDVSKEDFDKAKFDEWGAFKVARIRKHYSVDCFPFKR